MALSRRCIETLVDLAEIKLSCLDVFDREDRDAAKTLAESIAGLKAMLPGSQPALSAPVASIEARLH